MIFPDQARTDKGVGLLVGNDAADVRSAGIEASTADAIAAGAAARDERLYAEKVLARMREA